MNREEKRVIRLEICKILENQCKGCEYRNSQGETPTYCYTVCSFGKKLIGLSSSLLQDEEGIKVAKKVESQSEVQPIVHTGPWSQEEEYYLLNHINLYQVYHLSKRLNRAPKSVSAKISYLKRKYPDLIKHKKKGRLAR